MASTSIPDFQQHLATSRSITVLSGAGTSAESGIPTFRGAGGLWRRWSAQDLATPQAWNRDPGLVWEFYDYRRQVMADKGPNPAHTALASLEQRWTDADRGFNLVTQNIDGLHAEAGSKNITRMHGSLWHIRCLDCGMVQHNRTVPITPAFEGAGDPDPNAHAKRFSAADLPSCNCGGTQRPHVVWFGEGLDPDILEAASLAAMNCSTFIVVGTSAVVYPAAGLVPLARSNGAIVVEVNLDSTPATQHCDFVFQGKAGEILPDLLAVDPV